MPRKYQRVKIEENPERQVVLGMVVSSKFLQSVQPILKLELIETNFILTVMNWCLSYYDQFKEAPGIHIENLYQEEVKNGNLDEDQETLIAELLTNLSSEYERADNFNYQYLLDVTEKYFEGRNLKKKSDGIRTALSKGDVLAAQQEILDYSRIALPKSIGIDPFTDRQSMIEAFDSASEPIMKLPGAAGKFLNDLFVREGFVVLLGPEKRGKTFTLIELSLIARRCGLNVAFFSAGDMSLPQLQVRYGIRFTGRSNKAKYCGELKVPCLDCKKNQDDSCGLAERTGDDKVWDEEKKTTIPWDECEDHVVCTACLNTENRREFKPSSWYKTRPPVQPLTGEEAASSGERLNRRWGKKSKLLIASYNNGTLSTNGMRHQLNLWRDELGFYPDVIISDYMDLLISEKTSGQFRHDTNRIWAEQRGLAQELHCLNISASQSDAASYYSKWITLKNFSEDKRKFSHVTGMITLNQLPDEKRKGIMRLGQLVVREDASDESAYVTILQSLAQGKPLITSY